MGHEDSKKCTGCGSCNDCGTKPDFRETLYTVGKDGRRKYVYPTVVDGAFRRRRTVVVCLLMLVYLLMPWIEVGGQQAVLLSIADRKFVFFGTTFWATDTRFLVVILASLGLSLFFFTALLGRVWCGWACPQTVFLEFVFRPIEAWIEGSPAARKALDGEPWSARKLRIKSLKYIVYAAIAWILASTALAYFLGRERLFAMMSASPTNNLGMFLLTLAMMTVVLFEFGWFREQFCTVVCPYARFQSVLLDSKSLLVGYDARRGEPRRPMKKGESKEGAGDCIDCGLCVRVCPTGIDIRNGLQLECVQCTACIDACNSIMTKIGRAPGLIRYDTEEGLAGAPHRILRPRVIAYGLILSILAVTFIYLLQNRQLTDVGIARGARDVAFVMLDDGRVSNHLHLHLSNKGTSENQYTVTLLSPSNVELVVPGLPVTVAAQSDVTLPLFANFSKDALTAGRLAVRARVTGHDGFSHDLDFYLLGPG